MSSASGSSSTPDQRPNSDRTKYHRVVRPVTPKPWQGEGEPPVRHPETLGDLIEIRPSPGKGLGMFALCDIEVGTNLLVERPMIILSRYSMGTELDECIAELSQENQYKFQHMTKHMRETIDTHANSRERIVDCNAFEIDKDTSAIFDIAGKANHSCIANSCYVWVESIEMIVFWNRYKLLAGEEITVNYGHGPKNLLHNYGFVCVCESCAEREYTDTESSASMSDRS